RRYVDGVRVMVPPPAALAWLMASIRPAVSPARTVMPTGLRTQRSSSHSRHGRTSRFSARPPGVGEARRPENGGSQKGVMGYSGGAPGHGGRTNVHGRRCPGVLAPGSAHPLERGITPNRPRTHTFFSLFWQRLYASTTDLLRG